MPIRRQISREQRSFMQSVEWIASWQAFNAAARKGTWEHGKADIARYWLVGFLATLVGYAKGLSMRCLKLD